MLIVKGPAMVRVQNLSEPCDMDVWHLFRNEADAEFKGFYYVGPAVASCFEEADAAYLNALEAQAEAARGLMAALLTGFVEGLACPDCSSSRAHEGHHWDGCVFGQAIETARKAGVTPQQG